MENSLTASDYALLEHRNRSGMAATGIGLAAGLGGAALIAAFFAAWGTNQASKARAKGATDLADANRTALNTLQQNLLAERQSREGWQNANQPSIQSYIDVQATPSQSQTSTATAAAEAAAYAQLFNNNGLSSAVGTDSFLKVQRYSAPIPCGCDICNQ